MSGGLHLLKLCVGARSPADLRAWRAAVGATHGGLNVHTTRNFPKQAEALLDGGSLYWVMAGQVRARQRLVGVERAPAGCALLLDARLIETEARPRRAFQGWRYLKAEDAPPDLGRAEEGCLPPDLAAALRAIGAW